MKYSYYPNLIKFIKPRLKKKFPRAVPKRDQKNVPGHLLWMMEEIQKLDNPAKRGRWIGWLIAHAEMLGLLTFKQSHRFAKKDSHGGFV